MHITEKERKEMVDLLHNILEYSIPKLAKTTGYTHCDLQYIACSAQKLLRIYGDS